MVRSTSARWEVRLRVVPRAHRVDARELNLDREDAARPATLSRPRRAQAARDLSRAAVEDRDRAVSPPGREGEAGVGGEVLPIVPDGLVGGRRARPRSTRF